MTRMLIALAVVLSLARVAAAQTPVIVTAGSSLVWTQPAADVVAAAALTPAAAVAEVTALTVMLYIDGVAIVPVLPGKTCGGTVYPFTCTVPLPPMANGQHTLTITVWRPGNLATGAAAVESPHSDPFVFVRSVVAVAPAKPVNLRTTP